MYVLLFFSWHDIFWRTFDISEDQTYIGMKNCLNVSYFISFATMCIAQPAVYKELANCGMASSFRRSS